MIRQTPQPSPHPRHCVEAELPAVLFGTAALALRPVLAELRKPWRPTPMRPGQRGAWGCWSYCSWMATHRCTQAVKEAGVRLQVTASQLGLDGGRL